MDRVLATWKTSMLFKPSDFPADYITKELASKVAEEVFQRWVEENQVCTHPKEKIRATKLSWEIQKCLFYCDGCCKSIEVTKWMPVNTQKS